MILREVKRYDVLNYNENQVSIKTSPSESQIIEPCVDGIPSVSMLTFDEIKFVNNTRAFKSGLLEFSEQYEDELYDELGIDKTKVLKLNEIKEILLRPTKEGLKKILTIQALSEFDRVRGMLQKLKFEGYSITLDIDNIVNRRSNELFRNQIRTSIIIEDSDEVVENKKISDLERQLAEMKALLESAISANVVKTNDVEADNEKEEKTVVEKPIVKKTTTKTTATKKVTKPRKTTAKSKTE